MSTTFYQWMKVSTLTTGLHIHVDELASDASSDYQITSIEQVGKNVIEMKASRFYGRIGPVLILHRKPTDEVSAFTVSEGKSHGDTANTRRF